MLFCIKAIVFLVLQCIVYLMLKSGFYVVVILFHVLTTFFCVPMVLSFRIVPLNLATTWGSYLILISTFTADPCPMLFNPLNGAIECTGPQVTDESCNYTCQPGYNLTGPVMRSCQPDHTWSGDPTTCPPKQCVELVGQNNAFVVTPCGQYLM